MKETLQNIFVIIRKAAVRSVSVVLLPVSIIAWLIRLCLLASRIRHADRIVLMTAPNSFAYTVLGPDVLRRMYPGEKCLFLVAVWRHEFNFDVPKLWTDIDVVFVRRFMLSVPFRHRVISLPLLRQHDYCVHAASKFFCRIVSHRHCGMLSLPELHAEMHSRYKSEHMEGCGDWEWSYSATIVGEMINLQNASPAPAIHIPREDAGILDAVRNERWGNQNGIACPKLCCLYIREERRDAYSARLRNGSPLESHFGAVRLLNDAGYQVCLVGDYDPDQSMEGFHGGLIDHNTINVRKDAFQIYSATEADIFIGQNGGGASYQHVNGTLSLYINLYPFHFGLRNSWGYYKSLLDDNGDAVSARDILEKYIFDDQVEYGTLLINSEREIADAVSCFLKNISGDVNEDLVREYERLVPENTMFNLSGARISEAWIKNNSPAMASEITRPPQEREKRARS